MAVAVLVKVSVGADATLDLVLLATADIVGPTKMDVGTGVGTWVCCWWGVIRGKSIRERKDVFLRRMLSVTLLSKLKLKFGFGGSGAPGPGWRRRRRGMGAYSLNGQPGVHETFGDKKSN